MKNISHRWIGFALLLLAFWPTWRWYFHRLTDQSDEPLGLFALAAAGLLIWRKSDSGSPLKGQPRLTLILLLVYAGSFPFVPPLISGGIAMLTIASHAGAFTSQPGITALLTLSLPLESSLQFFLGYPLRRIATEFSVLLLKWIGLPVQSVATQILDGEKVVSVAPACAGIQMLWLTLVMTCFLAGWYGILWRKFLILIPTAILLVLLTNGIRITALFFKETGRITLPDWTHDAIGLLAFAFLIPVILKISSGTKNKNPTNQIPQQSLELSLIVASLITAGIPLLTSLSTSAEHNFETVTNWPEKWRGKWLDPLPLTRSERQFTKNFPGTIAAFEAGDTRLILRYIIRPTRKLHPSRDCFRASGFTIEGDNPAEYEISHEDAHFRVRESIHAGSIDSPAEWYHPSEWYWDALLGKSKGPWIAVTELQPLQ